jgi:D-amino-acid dehydrogenase
MNQHSQHVAVIGGGIIGTACAHYLAEDGWRVTLIDRSDLRSGCSHGNCGLICPSHVLPLAEAGAVGKAIRAMVHRNSPFSIKPRLDPSLWNWLVRFARQCNRHAMLESARAIHALLQSSATLYPDLIGAQGLECQWQHKGLLLVFRGAAEFEAYGRTVSLLQAEFGVSATRYEGDAVGQLEPALVPGLAGGWHHTADAHVRPDLLMTAWQRSLQQRGVALRADCEFRDFQLSSGAAQAIETSQGRLAADAFVVATGAMTPLLRRALGCRLPIQPGKGYCLTMPRPDVCPEIPLIFPEHKVAVTPFADGYRLGSTMEFAGYDSTLPPARLQLLRDGAEPYLREPYGEPVQERWYGWRPMTCDSRPFIDRLPGIGNAWVAAGHNMLGVSMAPATGRLVAELISRRQPHIDPTPYALRTRL